MKKILKYLEIEYTEKDLDYINDIEEIISKISQEIVDFFEIKDFGEKVNVYLMGDLEKFRKLYMDISKKLFCEDWICGFAPDDKNVYTLCLEEYRKTEYHENENLMSLIHLIMHEFTHSICHKINDDQNMYYWLGEGIACELSHQYDKCECKNPFDATLEQVCYGQVDYDYYRTMFSYVLQIYGREYILKLIKDNDLLFSETPRLYDEVKNNLNKKIK